MRHVIYTGLLLASALALILGAASVLERRASRPREVRIETPSQPTAPPARSNGIPVSSKARANAKSAAIDDGQ